ncbi:hypothetical protein ACLOJK_010754 [Asimina triloba]
MGMAEMKPARRGTAGVDEDVEFEGGGASLADMVLGFFEEGGMAPLERCGSDGENDEGESEEGKDSSGGEADRKVFWEEQHRLLKGTLYRSSSLETRIRHDTEQALRESRAAGPVCVCSRPVAGGCRNCLLRDVSDRLRNAGYDSALCRSKWRSTPDIPKGILLPVSFLFVVKVERACSFLRDFRWWASQSRFQPHVGGNRGHDVAENHERSTASKNIHGPTARSFHHDQISTGEHTYIDVMGTTSKNVSVRIIIELDFRGEFAMARASPEYSKLVERLPQVFVGKAERLRSVLKTLCAAAKKCTKENKMHMAPWRKHKYMEAKWLGTCERKAPKPLAASPPLPDPQRKLRASMLTFDLLEKLPSMHCTAVEVV